MDEELWNAIATLPSLNKLTFMWCRSLQGPANVKPEKRIRVRVPHLQILRRSVGFHQALAVNIDAQCLRALDIDCMHLDQVDWHLLSSLTELGFYSERDGALHGTWE